MFTDRQFGVEAAGVQGISMARLRVQKHMRWDRCSSSRFSPGVLFRRSLGLELSWHVCSLLAFACFRRGADLTVGCTVLPRIVESLAFQTGMLPVVRFRC